MTRLLSILLILGFLSPSLSLASSTEIPDDEAFLTIYFFIDDDGSVFAVASLTDELFLWAYAPRSAGATRASDNGAMNLHSTSFANPHAATSIGNLTLTYNQNGNVLTRSDKISHTWDYNNRLIKVAPTPTLTYAYYTYDSSGTRITSTFKNESQAPATTTYPTAYFNTDGTTQKEHLFVNGVPAATVEKIGTGNPTLFWNFQDHLQSTSVVTNNSANIVEQVEYKSFGSIKNISGTHTEQRKYTGHEFDILSKYTYAQARYLDTKVGRFLSEDMAFLLIGDQGFEDRYNRTLEQFLADPQLLNSYSYARNNPLKYTDPDGEISQEDILAQLAAIQLQIERINQTLISLGLSFFIGGPTTAYAPANNINGGSQGGGAGGAGVLLAGSAGSSPNVNPGLQVGQKTAFGEVVENTAGRLTSFTSEFTQKPFHGLERFLERGVTIDQFYDTLRDPLVTIKQAGGNILRLSEEAVVVLDKAGGLVTTYSKTFFKAPILNILKLLR